MPEMKQENDFLECHHAEEYSEQGKASGGGFAVKARFDERCETAFHDICNG
jgi:hypothetical protein